MKGVPLAKNWDGSLYRDHPFITNNIIENYEYLLPKKEAKEKN
jgi:hypothetical protein